MKYKVTINDCPIGWVKNEETKSRARLFELKQQAHENARRCVKELGKDAVRNRHFVYYYELDERMCIQLAESCGGSKTTPNLR